MKRTYDVNTRVTIDDEFADDPEMEFAAVALAVAEAARVLTRRSEGLTHIVSSVSVEEVL